MRFNTQAALNPWRWPIAAVTWGAPRFDVFITHWPGSPLYHYWRDAETGGFHSESMGGSWHHPCKAVSWGPKRLDVFAVGDDAKLYHHWQG
jgi:hypothetical protein